MAEGKDTDAGENKEKERRNLKVPLRRRYVFGANARFVTGFHGRVPVICRICGISIVRRRSRVVRTRRRTTLWLMTWTIVLLPPPTSSYESRFREGFLRRHKGGAFWTKTDCENRHVHWPIRKRTPRHVYSEWFENRFSARRRPAVSDGPVFVMDISRSNRNSIEPFPTCLNVPRTRKIRRKSRGSFASREVETISRRSHTRPWLHERVTQYRRFVISE